MLKTENKQLNTNREDVKKEPNEQAKEEKQEMQSDLPLIKPAVTISENENSYEIVANMPGVSHETLDISIEKNELSIEGQPAQLEDLQEYKKGYSEFGIGKYYQAFILNDQVDRDKISASMRYGQLRLVLPKKIPQKTKIKVLGK